ncbi:tetratricopeptide repeat protein [Tautonia marina]|uniref:tetratricopeptide repeat protein n=1 Tax=Tautonia marina TaxID=2653855 RepID=UPI001260F2C3|nr:tetratricopeptide repeat protein [Tautonia marina]
MRRFNWIFFLVLLTIAVVTGLGVYLIHGRQVQSQASGLLDYARNAESAGDLDLAVEHLERFLQFERDDPEAWALYARIVDRRDAEQTNSRQVFQVLEQALRFVPDDEELRRRCVDLALEMGNFEEARRHLNLLYEAVNPDDPDQQSTAAELEAQLGRCEVGLARFREAETWFRKALEHDPGTVDASLELARVLRDRLERPADADAVIAQMVEANPESARARLLRWQYQEQYELDSDPEDVTFALQAAPDDDEVLLAAALLAERNEDRNTARSHLRHAIETNPDQPDLYLAAASLETQDQKPEQAVAILEQGVESLPDDLEIRFFLVDALISQRVQDQDPAGAESPSDDELNAMILDLKKRGMAEGFTRYLEARVLFHDQQWARAIRQINTARRLLAGLPDLVGRLDLMLAECHGRLGADDQQVAALRQAAERGTTAPVARLELARRLENDGNPEAAFLLHLMLLEERPESQLDLVRLLIQQNLQKAPAERNWREAEERLALAERVLPESKTDVDLLRVDLLLAQDQVTRAQEVLASLVRRDPDDWRVPIAQARMAERQGNSGTALKLLDQAEAQHGAARSIDLERIANWTRQGGDEAKAFLTQFAARVPDRPAEDQPALLEALAVAFLRLGEVEQSRSLWKQLAEAQPDNIRLRMVLIDLALAAAEPDEVRDHVDAMRRIEGPDGLLWRYAEAILMLDLASRGDANALRTARDRAREINVRSPEWWGSYAITAQIAEREGQIDAATQNYLLAIERGANQPTLARRLVGLLYQQQQFDTIDRVAGILERRNAGLADLTLIEAMNALRRGEVDRGIALARRILPEDSTNAADHLFVGRMMVYSGRYDDAEPVLRRALELSPADPTAWLSYAECQLRRGQDDRVRAMLTEAPQAVAADQRELTLARLQDLLGETDEARKTFEEALRKRPDDLGTLRSVIEFTVRNGDSERANALLERVRDPGLKATEADLAWANRMRSMMLLQSGDLAQVDEALEIVRTNLEENPYSFDDQKMRAILLSMRPSRRQESIDALKQLDQNRALEPNEQFLLAMLHGAGGDWQASRSVLTRIVDNPVSRDPRPLIFFISLLLDQGDLDEAGRRIPQLHTLLGETLQVVALDARLLKERGNDPDAAALIERYAESHPDEIGSIANLFDQLDFPEQAEAAYQAFIDQDPEEKTRRLALVAFLAQQGRTNEALSLCDTLRADVPPEALAELAVSALALNPEAADAHYEQVERWLLDALTVDPDSGPLLVQLAVLRTLQENYPEAESRYRDALRRDPNNLQALNNLAWLIGFRDPSGSEALALIEQAIERAGSVPALLDTRAVLRLLKGQVELALEDLRIALANAPDIPQLSFHLAWAQQTAGNLEEAREAFEMAKQQGLKQETVDSLERGAYHRLENDLSK